MGIVELVRKNLLILFCGISITIAQDEPNQPDVPSNVTNQTVDVANTNTAENPGEDLGVLTLADEQPNQPDNTPDDMAQAVEQEEADTVDRPGEDMDDASSQDFTQNEILMFLIRGGFPTDGDDSSYEEAESSLTALKPEDYRKMILYPKDIYAKLTQFTIGQNAAMKSLASFVHEHQMSSYLREMQAADPDNLDFEDLDLDKPNILMMGPTGCGKTSSLSVLAKILKVPLAIGNATEWTSQGYIGGKWTDVFDTLMRNAKAELKAQGLKTDSASVRKMAERGIVFIDEIDKLCTKGELDVVERVQQELLPVIQGTVLNTQEGMLDTKNILFITGGAFPGLIPSDKDRDGSKNQDIITPKMLENYGLLPELAGRLCNIVQFSHLSKNDLKQIILKSKGSALAQYIRKYKLGYGIDLTFDDDVIDYIAEVAATQNTGARALNAMLFTLMKNKTFEIEDYMGKPIRISKKEAEKALSKFKEKPYENPSYANMYI